MVRASPAIASMDATLQTAGECIARVSRGSNQRRARDMQSRRTGLPRGSGRAPVGPGALAVRRAPLYCRPCEPTTLWVPLRDRRDARPDPPHLPRHPELRRSALPRPAAVDGAHARARPVRPRRQADAPLRAYKRGDIVVFNPPASWTQQPDGTPYIKRVIGVGGDTVEIKDDGSVCVNGTKLDRAVPLRRRRPGPADRRVRPEPLGRARRASCS